ncbi:hypothetical protein ACSFBM_15520 [Variovorax sp. GB1R11]|uniref:hypothetical protein n=1 Tax=Variovorax sp. GB1R11 TaxID=3443741 RepID=UPI003F467852
MTKGLPLDIMLSVRTTPTDAHLARIYYDILLDHARNHPGQAIRYKEVLERARRAHPNDEVVQSAIPISMGRRLEVIVQFLGEHQLPPLTCLAVNETSQPGASYRAVNGSWQADMDVVSGYDWSRWRGQWDSHLDAARKAAVQLKRRKEQEALNLVHEAYVAGQIPKLSQDQKNQLIELLREGLAMEDAMAELAKPT